MGKCPFCGAEPSTGSYNIGATRAWECETNYAMRTPFGKNKPEECLFRKYKCYETELASLKNELTQAQARIRELEADLNQYAVLKVLKSSIPPGASLVVCYEVNGVPVLADERYEGYEVREIMKEQP